MASILSVQNLFKSYSTGSRELSILDNISFQIQKGESVAIVGTSGSGKTTLLGLCAGLDQPNQGEISLCGHNMTDLNEDQRATVRNNHVGFIFQDFQLVSTLTALENVAIPLELRGEKRALSMAQEWLDKVGLSERLNHYPNQLSGGEQQRVALARAFANAPDVLFADEPTGNLDEATSAQVEDLLFRLNQEKTTTLIIVTHDMELARKTDRMILLKAGKIDNVKSVVSG